MNERKYDPADIKAALPGPDDDEEEDEEDLEAEQGPAPVELIDRLRRQRLARGQAAGGMPSRRVEHVQPQSERPGPESRASMQGGRPMSSRPEPRPQPSVVRNSPIINPERSRPTPRVVSAVTPNVPILAPREHLSQYYNVFKGAIGVICQGNSTLTTIVGVYAILGFMFPGLPGIVRVIVGALLAVFLFLGQIFHADYETLKEIQLEDGSTALESSVDERSRTAYYGFLTPDVLFTLWFWIPPVCNVFVYLLFNQVLGAASVRDVANGYGIAWSHSWPTLIAFTIALLLTITIVVAGSVASAYFPEQSLLGPRTREIIRKAVRDRLALVGA